MVLIVVPTYNEAENLPGLLAAIVDSAPDAHILIVDDDSPDGTAAVAEAAGGQVKVLRRGGPRGYGRACLDGFRYAIDHNYDIVLTMDADWSHDPIYIPAILKELELGADMVTGSRYSNGVSVVNWPLRRVILSVFANSYVRAILRLPITDCTSGYRGYKVGALRSANLSAVFSDGYAFLVEIATRIHRAGFTLKETPIIFVERRAGQSKMSKKVMFESAIIPWKLRFTRFRRATEEEDGVTRGTG
jgi:dolichol-phosphate mannosyltransferase